MFCCDKGLGERPPRGYDGVGKPCIEWEVVQSLSIEPHLGGWVWTIWGISIKVMRLALTQDKVGQYHYSSPREIGYLTANDWKSA